MAKIKVAVGSTNPVKVNAVKKVFTKVYKDIEMININVDSEISDQPMTDEEGIKGAINRAKNSLKETKADFGIGLEGTYDEIDGYGFTGGWVAIIDKENNIGIGHGGKVLLPKKISDEIRKGKELGPLLDQFMNEKNLSKGKGAIGVFTDDLITRQSSFEIGIKYALAKFVKKELY